MDERDGDREEMDPEGIDGGGTAAPVRLPTDVVEQYPRFSLYNSPYPAHDHGRAIDLYPEDNAGLSPIAGEVLDTQTVTCPARPYAVDHDHLIVVDTGEHLVRILHVEPSVEPGNWVAVGDSLGEMVRSGFFGRWVDNHIHLEFRNADRNPYRASGSLPLTVDVPVRPLEWDGTGTVVEAGDDYALLDAPAHPGNGYATVASDGGLPLDGGLAHYSAGGLFGPAHEGESRTVELYGESVGVATDRDVAWGDVAVLANDERITGLSLFASTEPHWGVKLVTRESDPTFRVGDEVRISIRTAVDPVRLD